MRRILTLFGCLVLSILLVVFFPLSKYQNKLVANFGKDNIGMFNQAIEGVSDESLDSYALYYEGKLIGHINNKHKFDKHLKETYKNQFKEMFPKSELNYDNDIYITKQKTNNIYSDIDDEILNWIKTNELYSIEATYVSIVENGTVKNGIYVKDEETYQEAMNTFLSYFIDQKSLAVLNQGAQLPSLSSFGSRDLDVSIDQKIIITKKFIAKEKIMMSVDEVLEFLKYGDNKEREYYTVQQYDTVAGVGSKNHGLSATQVMNINRDKIKSIDQILNEGDELCVTYFTSPLSINVKREVLRENTILYNSDFVEDEDLLEGTSEVRRKGENGTRNVLYEEKWINGVIVEGEEISSSITKEATNEVIAVGTKSLPHIGTGNYRYPVDNAAISCPWGCYFGHVGVDFINLYEPWGNVYAVDNGVVVENSYTGINGNYVYIDHNNGYRSYYGHMREPSPIPVGTIVQKGDVIGTIGMTGYATGPHVHFHFDDGVVENRFDACNGFLDCSGAR